MTMIPDIHQLFADLDNNTNLFLDILDAIPKEKLQLKNRQTTWSIMECAEHILISEQAVCKALQGPSHPITDRAPDSKVEQITQDFMEFGHRLRVAGEPETLNGGYKDIASFSPAFRENREMIKTALRQAPLEWLCENMEHNNFGYLTRLEWAYYLMYHAERHLQQINRIEASLENMP
jgi:hypothetical protein